MLMAVFGASRLLDGLFHGLQDLFALDPFVSRHGLRHLQQLGTRNDGFIFHRRRVFQLFSPPSKTPRCRRP